MNESEPIGTIFEYMCPIKTADAMQSVDGEFGVVIKENILGEGERVTTPYYSSDGHMLIVPKGSVFLRFSQENGSGPLADFWKKVEEIEDSKKSP